jgi:hypothetical protein
MQNDREEFIQALAKQAYRHQLLVRALHAGGHLRPREPDSLWNEEEFAGFLKVFHRYFSGQRSRKPHESGES